MLHTVRAENLTFLTDADDIVTQVFANVEEAWEKIASEGPWTFGTADFTLIRLDTFLDFLLTLATDKYEREALAQYNEHLEQFPTFVNLEHYPHNSKG